MRNSITLQICGIASRIVCTSTRMPRIRWIERSGRNAFVNRRIETAGKPLVNCSTKPETTTMRSSQFLCRWCMHAYVYTVWPRRPR